MANMLCRVFVIMPVFFDGPSATVLSRQLREVWAQSEYRDIGLSIVWVDDSGGVDRDIRALAQSVEVIVERTSMNLGQQGALHYGLQSIAAVIVEGEIVVTMDADGEDRALDVVTLVGALEAGHWDLVLAKRGRREGAGLRFRAGYGLAKVAFKVLTGVELETGAFAAMTAETARALAADPICGIAFGGTLLTIPLRRTFVTCDRGQRIVGESTVKVRGWILHGLMMLVPQLASILVRSTYLLAVAVLVGVTAASVAIAIRVFTSVASPGWATSVVLGSAIIASIALLIFLLSYISLIIVRLIRAAAFSSAN